MSDNTASLQVKQKRICDNIPISQQEQFGGFCLDYAGNVDIESWSIAFIDELIERYNETKRIQQQKYMEENPCNSSFAIYQTGNEHELREIAQKVRIQKQAEERQKIERQMKKKVEVPKVQEPSKKQRPPSAQSKQKSVGDPKTVQQLMESILSHRIESNSAPITPRDNTPNPNNFKSQPVNSSFFDSNNFWAVPGVQNNNKPKPAQTKQNNMGNSFAYLDFDVFTQMIEGGSSSTIKKNQAKVQSPTLTVSKQPENKTTKAKSPSVDSPQNINIKFQDFLSIVEAKKEKKQSPYQKKHTYEMADSFPQEDSMKLEKKQVKVKEIINIQSTDKRANKVPYDGVPVFRDQFEDYVPCFPSTIRKSLADPTLRVSIKQHQIIHRGFFSPDYAMYNIEVLPTGIQCKRNYQDFSKLKAAFQRIYPGIQVPYLQSKSWFSETNPQFIKKQKTMLQFFITDILYNKQLRNSRILEDFLTIRQHKKMKRKFEQYDKLQKLVSIQQLCLIDGKVECKINEDTRKYEEKVSKYLFNLQNFLERQRSLSETLQYQYDAVLTTLNNLSQLMKQMQKQTKNFNNHVMINQVQGLDEVFNKLSRTYKQMHLHNKFEQDMLQLKIIPFLKYEKDNISTLQELISTRNHLTRRYVKRLQTQSASSNQPYTSEKLKHYKIGVVQESKNIQVLKYQVGYFNSQVCKQSQRVLQLMGIKFNGKWDYVANKHIQRLNQSIQFWNTIKI